MKRSECTDEEFGGRLTRLYDKAAALNRAGAIDVHPSEAINKWARDIKAARDAASSEIEPNDQPTAQDDPADFPGKPAGPARNGASLQCGAANDSMADLARAIARGPRGRSR